MQTELFEVDPLSDNRKLYARAAEALGAGALVGIPTETVYGLGADALNPEAVARIFEAKGRPSFDPLIIHVHHGSEVEKYTAVPEGLKDLVHTLASKFWPGPLTMVLPKADIIPDIVTSGLPTVAVRVSAHPAMRGVAKALGRPVAAPSANRFGHISPTSASAVQKELDGRIEMILDAGACSEGLESTIVRPVLDEKGKPSLELLREGR
ncbi:MAG: L-threonylcarbamoyladenylate synthase [Akkermansia sp.]